MYCDNQIIIFIASNSTFNDQTKHIKQDYHYTRDKVLKDVISMMHIASLNQLVDIFIKPIKNVPYESLSNKIGIFDLYALV